MTTFTTSNRIQPPWIIATLRVPYADTDAMGHVYYANYYRYFEAGRNEWMRTLDFPYKQFEELGYIVPVAESHCQYRDRVFYDDLVEVWTRAELKGRARFRFDYVLKRQGEDKVLAEGYTVHAVLTDRGKPVRVPSLLGEMLEKVNQMGDD